MEEDIKSIKQLLGQIKNIIYSNFQSDLKGKVKEMLDLLDDAF